MKCFRLRCYVNNSFLVFHQGTKHSKTIKHSRFALVFHTVFSCLDPLMKHSNSLFTYNISSDDVQRALLSLDDNKATGPDKIPAKLLRCCAPYISSSLADLFNRSLTSGSVPAEWKVSNIIPIPKGGQKKEVSNYRSISLLPIVSKVLELAYTTNSSTMSQVNCITSNMDFSGGSLQHHNY